MRQPEPGGRDDLGWFEGLARFGVKPGLDRMRSLLRAAGDPQRRFATVLVAGTNGKGSTVAGLAGMLAAAGKRTGRFTSPHLHQLSERFWIDGRFPDEASLVRQLGALRPAAERVGATSFEVLTASACRLFAEAGVEMAVFEVGLGGSLDATNALDPELSIVTNVGLDHVDLLGDSLEAIAADKAGILRHGRPAWTAATGIALAAIERRAREIGADLAVSGTDFQVAVRDLGWRGLGLTVVAGGQRLVGHTALVGRHQGANLGLAVAAALQLRVPHEAIRRGLATLAWPGRLERIALGDRWLVLDGAHNPAGALALAAALKQLVSAPFALVFGASADKDAEGMVAALQPGIDRLIVTQATSNPRSMTADQLAARVGGEQAATLTEALDLALGATSSGGTVVVAGSLFLVAEARAIALGKRAGT